MQRILASEALTPNGWQSNVSVEIGDDGLIAHVGPSGVRPDATVDLLLPAPGNVHSHTFQRAMAGLTEGRGPDGHDSFWTWRQIMYRFLDQLTPDHVQAIAELAFMEMLEAGFGSVAEFHYLHNAPGGEAYPARAEMSARIIAAADTVGIGLTLLPVYYAQGGADGSVLSGGQLRFGNTLDSYATLLGAAESELAQSHRDDTAIGVAPHSLRAAPRDHIRHLAGLRPDAPMHIHVAEQTGEIEEIRELFKARPVEWLLANENVDARWCLVHATHMTEGETEALAKSRAVAGLCPVTEANLGDGVFRAETLAMAGGRFGVGSDSNVHISLFSELTMLEYGQRLTHQRRAVLASARRSTGRALFDAVASSGAQALGRRSGAISVGSLADLLAVSTDNEWVCGANGDHALDALIFTGRGHDCVSDVWSAGRHMVQGGRHMAREGIVRRFRQVIAPITDVL